MVAINAVGGDGKIEAGHHIGHIGEAIAIDAANGVAHVRLIGERKDRCRMRVVHVVEGYEGVQQRFDRGVWRVLLDEAGTQQRNYVRVGEFRGVASFEQRRKANGRQTRCLDRVEVQPLPLMCMRSSPSSDLTLTEVLPPPCSNKVRVAADDTRGVDTKAERLALFPRPCRLYKTCCVLVVPAAFHANCPVLEFRSAGNRSRPPFVRAQKSKLPMFSLVKTVRSGSRTDAVAIGFVIVPCTLLAETSTCRRRGSQVSRRPSWGRSSRRDRQRNRDLALLR